MKSNIPLGNNRWLTVLSGEDLDGPELRPEPSDHRAVKPYKDALIADGIPAHSFRVADLAAERKGRGITRCSLRSSLWTQDQSAWPCSTIPAAFIVLPLIRGDWLHSKRLDGPTVLSLVLLFYLISMFAKMGLQGTSLTGIFAESPTFFLMLFVGLAANFNPHRCGEIALFAAIVIGGYNISTVSAVMGFNGWLFVILIATGTLLTLNPSKLWSKP